MADAPAAARARAKQQLQRLRQAAEQSMDPASLASVPLLRVFAIVNNMMKEAENCAAQTHKMDMQLRAYKLYYQVSVLVVERFPKHRDYMRWQNTPEIKQVHIHASKALSVVHELKNRLEQMLTAEELANTAVTAAEPDYQMAQQQPQQQQQQQAQYNISARQPTISPEPATSTYSEGGSSSSAASSSSSTVAASSTELLVRPTRPSPPPPVATGASPATPTATFDQAAPPTDVPQPPRALSDMYAQALGVSSLTELPRAADMYDSLMRTPSQRQQLLQVNRQPHLPARSPPQPPRTSFLDGLPARAPPSVPGVNYTSSSSSALQRRTEQLRSVILPAAAIERFRACAAANSAANRETCGVLTGCIRGDTIVITHVLIPKQSGGSDSCCVSDAGEIELMEIQDRFELLSVGWIHTHPSQTAFLSSVDLHTSYPYQLMMPEALAIVCAIKHNQTGVYRLTPAGMQIIGHCTATGFHPHANSEALFENSGHVLLRETEHCEVLDLR